MTDTTTINLRPCPFCGGAAVFERMGTRLQSCIVACTNCGASLDTGEEGAACGTAWNTRTTDDAMAALKIAAAGFSTIVNNVGPESEVARIVALDHMHAVQSAIAAATEHAPSPSMSKIPA